MVRVEDIVRSKTPGDQIKQFESQFMNHAKSRGDQIPYLDPNLVHVQGSKMKVHTDPETVSAIIKSYHPSYKDQKTLHHG